MNPVSFLRIHYKFFICFANSPWIYFLFRDFNTNSLSVSRIHYEFTITFAISLWIYYIFHEFTIHFAKIPWIHYLIRRLTMNPLFTPEFTMDPLFFPRIHNLFRELIMNSLSVSGDHYKSSFFLANSLSVYYLFRNFTMNSL